MNYYYKTPIIGDGTEESPFRPNIPEGISWVGNCENGYYLIKTSEQVDPLLCGECVLLSEQEEVEAEAENINQPVDAVLDSWATSETEQVSISITSPLDGATYDTATPFLDWIIGNGQVLAVKVDGIEVNKAEHDNLDPLENGEHVVELDIDDNGITSTVSSTFTVLV